MSGSLLDLISSFGDELVSPTTWDAASDSKYEHSLPRTLRRRSSALTPQQPSSSSTWLPQRKVLWFQVIFLVTGLVSTLGSQSLYYMQAADAQSLLTILATYLGMALVFVVPSAQLPTSLSSLFRRPSIVSRRSATTPKSLGTSFASESSQTVHGILIVLSLLDVLGSCLLTVGMFFIGSGIYQVVYSSVIIFTALFTMAFLKRSISLTQWLSIIFITFGLYVSSLTSLTNEVSSLSLSAGSSSGTNSAPFLHSAGNGILSSLDSHKQPTQYRIANITNTNVTATTVSSNTSSTTLGTGFILTLIGTSIYASLYVLNDYYLTLSPIRLSPQAQCGWVGIYSTIIVMLLMCAISLPTIAQMPLLDWRVFVGYCILIVSSLYHNLAYFELLASTGAVATGVIQALRAVLVFVLSHIMYCHQDAAQCFTPSKGVAALIVVVGVVWFSFEKARAERLTVSSPSAGSTRSTKRYPASDDL